MSDGITPEIEDVGQLDDTALARPLARRITGIENEYGIFGIRRGDTGGRIGPESSIEALWRTYPNWSGSRTDFLRSQARLYIDYGSHPEFATAESDSLFETVVGQAAGERILDEMAQRAEREAAERDMPTDFYVFKNNLDTHGNSYGCHENYLTDRRVPFRELEHQLLPMFLTRGIYAGAGAVVNSHGGQVRFEITQRGHQMHEVAHAGTTSSRPIFNTRDEAHSYTNRYRRLHVIVGDANMNEVATFTKLGVVAVALRLVEDPAVRLPEFQFRDPVAVIRTVSKDVDLNMHYTTTDGRHFSAIDIQEAYLQAAMQYDDRVGLPPIEQLAVTYWEQALQMLRTDPMQLAPRCDWILKKRLIEQQLARTGQVMNGGAAQEIDLKYHDIRRDRGIFYRAERRGMVERVTTDDIVRQRMTEPQRPVGLPLGWQSRTSLEICLSWFGSIGRGSTAAINRCNLTIPTVHRTKLCNGGLKGLSCRDRISSRNTR